jgi:hypothetical protein
MDTRKHVSRKQNVGVSGHLLPVLKPLLDQSANPRICEYGVSSYAGCMASTPRLTLP